VFAAWKGFGFGLELWRRGVGVLSGCPGAVWRVLVRWVVFIVMVKRVGALSRGVAGGV